MLPSKCKEEKEFELNYNERGYFWCHFDNAMKVMRMGNEVSEVRFWGILLCVDRE